MPGTTTTGAGTFSGSNANKYDTATQTFRASGTPPAVKKLPKPKLNPLPFRKDRAPRQRFGQPQLQAQARPPKTQSVTKSPNDSNFLPPE